MAGADAVIHLAWQNQPGHDGAQLERTNVVGTRRLVDAVLAAGVRRLVLLGPQAAVERLLDSVAAAAYERAAARPGARPAGGVPVTR